MKRNIFSLLTLILIILSLSSCNSVNIADDSYPKSKIEEFITEMYNVEDYKKIDIKNFTANYPKDNFTNSLRNIATEDALESFITKRLQLQYITNCYELHVDSKITSKNINKYSAEKDGSIVYNYNGKVQFTFTDEDKQKEEDIEGQITVNKINNKWIITKFNSVSIASIAKYYKNSKQ